MKKLPVRIPTAKGTRWHKVKKDYDRKENKRKIEEEINEETTTRRNVIG